MGYRIRRLVFFQSSTLGLDVLFIIFQAQLEDVVGLVLSEASTINADDRLVPCRVDALHCTLPSYGGT